MMESVANQFRTDKWADQPCRAEVWVEKDALLGVIGPVCRALEIPFMSLRGYSSASEFWAARKRFLRNWRHRQPTYVLHLGDHDPSGLQITADLRTRLENMCCRPGASQANEAWVEVERPALNYDQVRRYRPPPNPAKQTDSRYEQYVAETGLTDSWELDALDPDVLCSIIEDRVLELRDDTGWDDSESSQEEMRTQLTQAAERWPDVVSMLEESD
jgi:hypothetical protein